MQRTVHEFKDSGIQGSISVPELHLKWVFTRKGLF
jgi:hypothetical protein